MCVYLCVYVGVCLCVCLFTFFDQQVLNNGQILHTNMSTWT